MLLKDDGKTIEFRIEKLEPHPEVLRMGVSPGVFPEQIIVKQRLPDGTDKLATYVQPSAPVGALAEDVLTALKQAIEFANHALAESPIKVEPELGLWIIRWERALTAAMAKKAQPVEGGDNA